MQKTARRLRKREKQSDIDAAECVDSCSSTQSDSLVQLAEAVKLWARRCDQGRVNPTDLLSLDSAIAQVNAAFQQNKKTVDIPLAPHLAFLGLEKELANFVRTITGTDSLKKPPLSNVRLIAKIIGEDGFEFRVDESKVRNVAVTGLLRKMREAMPTVNIKLMGKWCLNSGLKSPQIVFRLAIRSGAQDETQLTGASNVARIKDKTGLALVVSNKLNEQAGELARKVIADIKPSVAAKLGLPANASEANVENEIDNVKRVSLFRELLNSKHQELMSNQAEHYSRVLIGKDSAKNKVYFHPTLDTYSEFQFCKFHLAISACAAINLAALLVFRNPAIAEITTFVWGIVGCMIAVEGVPPRKSPRDPLNTIQSPSVRALVTEIRELGYIPRLKDNYLEVHTS